MTTTTLVKQRAACLLVASNKATMPVWKEENDNFASDVYNQVTDTEWRDALYQAWKQILEEETGKLVSVYKVLSGE